MSNALLKMAELGLTQAADVLLQNGANLNFEGQGEPRGAGEHRWLKVALPWAGSQAFGLCLTVLLGATSFISWVTTRRPTLGGLPSPCGFQVALTTSGPGASLPPLLPCGGVSRSSQLPAHSPLPLR